MLLGSVLLSFFLHSDDSVFQLSAIFHCILPVPFTTTCVLCVSLLLLLLYDSYSGVKRAYICVYIYYPFCTVLLLFTMYLSFYSVVGYIKRERKVLYSRNSLICLFFSFSLMLALLHYQMPQVLCPACFRLPCVSFQNYQAVISGATNFSASLVTRPCFTVMLLIH